MKRMISLFLILALLLCGCQTAPAEDTTVPNETTVSAAAEDPGVVQIELAEDAVYVQDGAGVYTDHDIVCYESGHDLTYGEGTEADAHDTAEAQAHTVVHITQPGTYRLTGSLSAGQIAIDLGADAASDPEAVVTLILDNVDISCTVAPAILFYNVYECGSADPETASYAVDTSAAGANVIIADGSVNNISGSYVARIYEAGTAVLSEDGTEVQEAVKLHKYDGAFYSKMSMNVDGNDGILNIFAENEGLDTECHLTINGGNIQITSGNDGINTNADGVSVTTINGGNLTINVTGVTGEGDGIDSNGWLVINGGSVNAWACGSSEDAGIDSDMGIWLNGGTVCASGNMLDQIAGGSATYAVFSFAERQTGGSSYTLKNEAGQAVLECAPANDFSFLIVSGDALVPGTYTFWNGETQLAGASGGWMGMGRPGGMEERPEDLQEPSEGIEEIPDPTGQGGFTQIDPGQMPGKIDRDPPDGDYQIPEQPGQDMQPMGGAQLPEGETMPQGWNPSEGTEGGFQQIGSQTGGVFSPFDGEVSAEFVIAQGGNQFSLVAAA